MADADDDLDWRCHVHPDRPAGVRCTRCDRPACPECAIAAPVGFQCRTCVRASPATTVRYRPRRTGGPGWLSVTGALVAACAAVFVWSETDAAVRFDLGLFGPAVAAGDWWRVVTSGFVHADLIHVGFNCLLLWQLGGSLEAVFGRAVFALVALASLLGGSTGALLLEPDALTVGASGIVFGLMGATVVVLRSRGVDPMASGVGGLLALNLVITFVLPGISIGGHVGGLAAGTAVGWTVHELEARGAPRWSALVLAAALATALAGVALVAAG